MDCELLGCVPGTHPAVFATGSLSTQHTSSEFVWIRKAKPGACGSSKATGTRQASVFGWLQTFPGCVQGLMAAGAHSCPVRMIS